MKKILLSALLVIAASIAIAQGPPRSSKKVQVAILFDTSNSMDGLIAQAKSRIWNIVNEVSTLRDRGTSPTIEFAIYEYGNDGLESSDDYIRQVLDLSTDLDEISQKLFALTTNGGSEFCGAVTKEALDKLKWSNDPSDLKMIYIAGNEAFDQGSVSYKKSCATAKDKNIFINTIFCGDHQQGINLLWKDGATCSDGDYFNIDSDKAIAHIDTPYDKEIQRYNDSLNTTYYGYGSLGREKKRLQMSEDANASSQAPSVAAERATAKGKKNVYRNDSWDLIDAVEGGKDLKSIKDEELPDEFKGKTLAEKEALLKEKTQDREKFQKKIAELAVARESFITDERARRAAAGEEADDFGSNVNESIMMRAEEIGFEKEVVVPE